MTWHGRLTSLLLSLTVMSCGSEDGNFGLETIPLRPIDATPGCFVSAPPPVPAAGEAHHQLLLVTRKSLDFQIGSDARAAELLTEPLVSDPQASRWFVGDERGFLEGQVVARGTGWSISKWLLFSVFEDGETVSVDLTLEVTPTKTTYDFGNRTLIVGEHWLKHGEYLRGCDPDSGISFEIEPNRFGPEGRDFESTPRCWPVPEGLEADDPSWDLQCLQIIQRVRRQGLGAL